MNCWFYYSPGTPKPVDVDRLDARAAETLATRRWRGDLVHWHEVLRPATVATSRALLAEDLTVLSDAELADHLERTIEHFLVHGPQHFEAVHGDAAAGALLHAARDWDLDPRSWSRRWRGRRRRPRPRSACSIASPRGCARQGRTSSTTSTTCGRSAAMRPARWTSCARTTGGGSSTTTSSSPRSSSARPPSCRRSGPRWRVDRSDSGRPGRPSARCASACRRPTEIGSTSWSPTPARPTGPTTTTRRCSSPCRWAWCVAPRSRWAGGWWRRAAPTSPTTSSTRSAPSSPSCCGAAVPHGASWPIERRRGSGLARWSLRPSIGSPSAPVAPPALGPNTVALVAMLDAYRQVAWRQRGRPVACRGHGRRPRRSGAGGGRHRSHRCAHADRAR